MKSYGSLEHISEDKADRNKKEKRVKKHWTQRDSNPRRPDPQPYPSTRGARSLGSPKLHGWTTFTSRGTILITPIVFPSRKPPKPPLP
ncbi:hypothetical protein L596_000006 [Steinernema carpocapsae]|uniref:Uncharacterized protein n=1 Tax=Steinernema carpocapsae TaxID=34508 RepID=A0A4U8UHI7_STECR|nr:hypothetical protein L596_000006 [Steinernema carpocapsae]